MTNGMIYVAAMTTGATIGIALGLAVAVGLLSWFISAARQRKIYETTVGSAEVKSREIIDEALKTAAEKKGHVTYTRTRIKLQQISYQK